MNCVSMNNQECIVRPTTMSINSNEPLFHPYSVIVKKPSGNYNNINNPYAKLCVPDVGKNIDIKVFNLMSRNNETRYMSSHDTFTCSCKLDASLCNDRQPWNSDKYRCECKELIDVM